MELETHPLYLQLQENKKRMTVARKAILNILFEAKGPLSVPEILKLLLKNKIAINKTTAYREVEFLLGHGIVEKVSLQTKEIFYEIKSIHHHHLICENCQRVEEIEVKDVEKELYEFEKKLSKQKRFLSISHSLQFFGMCSRCKA